MQSICFSTDGSKIAITSRDTLIRIFDVRSGRVESEAKSHQNMRDSRVLFVDREYLITTGEFFIKYSSLYQNFISIHFTLV